MSVEPIYRREASFVLAVLEVLDQALGPVDWLEVVDRFTRDGRPWKTVENVLYELDAFGAIHKVGASNRPGNTHRKAVKITPLGSAWLKGVSLPLPGRW